MRKKPKAIFPNLWERSLLSSHGKRAGSASFSVSGFILILGCLGCLLISQEIQAQLFFPTSITEFEDYPKFNTQYIKEKKIKSLTFDISDKKDLQIVVDKGLIQHYDFDTNGRLTRFYYTSIAKTIVKEVRHRHHTSYQTEYVYDTISTRFFYDDQGNLEFKRYQDRNYYEATYYFYDKHHFLIRELKAVETNESKDKHYFKLGVQKIIYEEKFEIEKTNEFQFKKKCLNDENRPFKEIIMDYDEQMRPLQYTESFVTTWRQQITTFVYNEKRQLIEKKFMGSTGDKIDISETFEYDMHGYVLTQKLFRAGTQTNELSFIYDDRTGNLHSFINRDLEAKTIKITKVLYRHYEGI